MLLDVLLNYYRKYCDYSRSQEYEIIKIQIIIYIMESCVFTFEWFV